MDIHRDEVNERLDKFEQLFEDLKKPPTLTMNETHAVLTVVQTVYSRAFDPEKRVLVAAALRSCLLDRANYRGGLRKRFLTALDALTFGDVVALAAIVYQDKQLAELAGFELPNRPTTGQLIKLEIKTSLRCRAHFTALEPQGLTWHSGVGQTGDGQVIERWGITELAEQFLNFIHGRPENLRRIIAESGSDC
jgi:hypothetical protein